MFELGYFKENKKHRSLLYSPFIFDQPQDDPCSARIIFRLVKNEGGTQQTSTFILFSLKPKYFIYYLTSEGKS